MKPIGIFLLAAAAFQPFSIEAVIIDHAHVAGASNYAQAVYNAIGRQKWFFTHASVGGNLVEGMHTLNEANPTRYRLKIYNWPGRDEGCHGGVDVAGTFGEPDYRAANPPAVTVTGMIYECWRENPPWENKLVCFSNSLRRAGWCSNKVDFAMDKFCWIDQDANPTNYVNTMARLEAMYPAIRFIYVTMPLTGLADYENDQRNDYNRSVRGYCAANGKWLFDIADIEAWSPAGVQQTYSSGGRINQRMYAGYAVHPPGEDWHLNAAGQERLALGWYAVAATAATVTAAFTFQAQALTNSIWVRWSDPVASGISSRLVHVRCDTAGYPTNPTAGSAIYTGTNRFIEHTGLTPEQPYYYTIWVSHDGTNFIDPP